MRIRSRSIGDLDAIGVVSGSVFVNLVNATFDFVYKYVQSYLNIDILIAVNHEVLSEIQSLK